MNKLSFVIIGVFLLFLSACSKDDESKVSQLSDDISFDVKSSLSPNDYLLASKKLVSVVNTRATLNSEDSCRTALQPLIDDGKLIQEQILEDTDSL